MYTHKCKLCGKTYESHMPHGNVCNECKNRPCEVCGKPFLHEWPYDQRTCSPECRHALRTDPNNIAQKEAKKKQTVLERYGVDNVSKLPEVKKKISDNIKTPERREKMRQWAQENYGVDHYSKSEKYKDKVRATWKEKYGVDNPAKADSIRAKISEKLKDPEIRARYVASCLAHYGVRHPNLVPEIQEQRKKTCLEHYGYPYYVMTPEYKKNCATNQISSYNRAFAEALSDKFEIDSEFEFRIEHKLYDIHIKNSNILIEINPTYTHSDLPNHWSKEGLPPNYHINKTKLAAEHGYRCIHVFDWDNLEKVCSLFSQKHNIFARKCEVSNLNILEAADFMNRYHLQGSVRNTQVAYGLYYQDRLVEVMTFGRSRYNKNYQWELLRLCTHSNYVVIGGASRLFKTFITQMNPTSIISYCDRSKFVGEVYTKIGMTLHHISPPAKVWSKGNKHITDNLLRQRGADQLLGTNYGKGTSNEECMINEGWRSVYDCGQLVFEWTH